MLDAVVGVGDGKEVTLMVANHGVEPVELEIGEKLGSLQPATIDLPQNAVEPEPPYVAAVQGINTDDERLANMSSVLAGPRGSPSG